LQSVLVQARFTSGFAPTQTEAARPWQGWRGNFWQFLSSLFANIKFQLYQEVCHMWTKPEYTEMRFGFEVTMYIANR